MAITLPYKQPRGTRSALNSLAGSTGIIVGQIYLITDENRLAVGLTTSTYQDFVKPAELLIRLTCGLQGKPTASLIQPFGVAPRAFTVTQANCSGIARTAATASYVATLKKRTTGGTETTVGTWTWSTSGTLATVSISAGSIASGDELFWSYASSADSTLADISFLVSE